MGKLIISSLVIIGLLIFLIGLGTKSGGAIFTGLLMIGGGAYLGLRPGGILRKEQIVDNWGILIGNAQGRKEEILEGTRKLIEETKAPAIKMERKLLAPGLLRGIMGEEREFLVITEAGNPRLSPYQMFVAARDYGNNLDVSWYLAFRPSLWQAILSLIPFVGAIPRSTLDLDLFDLQDLRAYVTNAHHCLLQAVEKLMMDLGQDVSKIDRKSKGFLGIS
jgi:hypothetical protein